MIRPRLKQLCKIVAYHIVLINSKSTCYSKFAIDNNIVLSTIYLFIIYLIIVNVYICDNLESPNIIFAAAIQQIRVSLVDFSTWRHKCNYKIINWILQRNSQNIVPPLMWQIPTNGLFCSRWKKTDLFVFADLSPQQPTTSAVGVEAKELYRL